MRLVASCELCDRGDRKALLRRLVSFLAAGLRAPLGVPSAPATTPADREAGVLIE